VGELLHLEPFGGALHFKEFIWVTGPQDYGKVGLAFVNNFGFYLFQWLMGGVLNKFGRMTCWPSYNEFRTGVCDMSSCRILT
jgi:hypothetical protein